MVSAIEEIVIKEFNGLCRPCIHFDGCIFRRSSGKIVVQCELFESGGSEEGLRLADNKLKGLCVNCSKTPFCRLPKEASGVWHCEEYE